ncbi:PRC-barrel domain protein [Methanocaldococcus villosus KIN24-T80]|uniref:PRC-barrel domain protein n=1 Tax=Methanocaldococcus villosus KIN24-T80 TaxID=1069083 RepID=N6UUV9_9EURY|nr:PRC-barrel domain-containing protein [Methanocaldococcus villosus]ENN96139.1 PRC-barrel domain protein [Methanocaldococcus villosus KIN24-T80]
MKKLPAKIIFGKNIVGNLGSVLGRVVDIVFDEKIGKIVSLEVEPEEGSPIDIADGKNVFIPYKAVIAIKDVVVIDEKYLTQAYIKPVE